MSADEDVIRASWGKYSGALYGKSSMVLYEKGVEIMHTGFRSEHIQTKDDLLKILKEMPEFQKILQEKWDELLNTVDEKDDI